MTPALLLAAALLGAEPTGSTLSAAEIARLPLVTNSRGLTVSDATEELTTHGEIAIVYEADGKTTHLECFGPRPERKKYREGEPGFAECAVRVLVYWHAPGGR